MRTSAREKYGSGPSLSTRQDRFLRLVVAVCIVGVITATCVVAHLAGVVKWN